MKKRLKKKLSNKYNVIKIAKRQSVKRKGIRCIAYEFLPIGEKDQYAMNTDEISPHYPFATHWLIDVYVMQNCSFINIYPCLDNGRSNSISPVKMVYFFYQDVEGILSVFNRVVDDMTQDRFWHRTY